MKKFLLIAFVITAAGLVTARAQSFSAGVEQKKHDHLQHRPAPVYEIAPIGAFPRATRGNPIQIINPRAPRKYFGPPSETVVADDVSTSPQHTRGESPNRFTGVILFGFRW